MLAFLFHTVAGIHYDLAWRQQFSCYVSRAHRGTVATLRAGIGIHQLLPGQVFHVFGTEALDDWVALSVHFRSRWLVARVQHSLDLMRNGWVSGELTLRQKLRVIHVREGHDDVEVLRA